VRPEDIIMYGGVDRSARRGVRAPSERIHMPQTIQKLLHGLQQKAGKRHQRERERLLLARQKLDVEGVKHDRARPRNSARGGNSGEETSN
jgi:hypothetical protein